MKFLILALCVAAALATSPDLDQEWQMWKDNNQRKYGAEEEDYRRFVWESNYKIVTEHNQRYALGHTTYTMAMNQFADMTDDEFSEQMNGYLTEEVPTEQSNATTDTTDLPTTVDWRTKGYVTPVKNQLKCGSCWAFGATGCLEGQAFKNTGKLPILSEQNLIDCATDPKYICYGCEGGTARGAFQYVIDNKGIESEASYPYKAKDGTCNFNSANVAATCTSYESISTKDEKALQKAVANIGPITVSYDSSPASFRKYSGGVYDEPACSQTVLNHCGLVVGYGALNGKDYWLLKNSWGPSWGMNGYIMMSRFKNNQCGIATRAVSCNGTMHITMTYVLALSWLLTLYYLCGSVRGL